MIDRQQQARERVVRTWVCWMLEAQENFGSPKSSMPSARKPSVRTTPTSNPGNLRCTLLLLGCFLHDLGEIRAAVLTTRCRLQMDKRSAGFDVVADEFYGMTAFVAEQFWNDAVAMFYDRLLDSEMPPSPFELGETLPDYREGYGAQRSSKCAAAEYGDLCALSEVAC